MWPRPSNLPSLPPLARCGRQSPFGRPEARSERSSMNPSSVSSSSLRGDCATRRSGRRTRCPTRRTRTFSSVSFSLSLPSSRLFGRGVLTTSRVNKCDHPRAVCGGLGEPRSGCVLFGTVQPRNALRTRPQGQELQGTASGGRGATHAPPDVGRLVRPSSGERERERWSSSL